MKPFIRIMLTGLSLITVNPFIALATDPEKFSQIEVVSHRGANRSAPENTIPAFLQAIREGADYIEIDVAMSRDSVFFCLHDQTVNRTTNGTGILRFMKAEDVDTLDAGSWFSDEFSGTRVPRVTDILEAVKGKAGVYFDVKDADLRKLISLVRTSGFGKNCFFWFSDERMAHEFRKLAPDLPLKVNISNVAELNASISKWNPQIVECDQYKITQDLQKACRINHIKLMSNILRDSWDEYRQAIQMEVDMVNTDHPGYFRNMEKTPGNVFSDFRLAAHRGGIIEGLFDEFDPRSIQAAIDSGYWMLEMDVRATADHQIILHHDNDFKRIYGIENRPEKMTLPEIKKLRALKGGYAPLTFEEAARMCEGRIRFMVDVKPASAEPWFYTELVRILSKYNMLDQACFIRNDIESFISGGRFGFRMEELPSMKKRMPSDEDIRSRYYLFDHGNRLNAETVRWCQQNGIDVCASVNIGHYQGESHLTGAARDIEYLQKCGVTFFQIDSEYDKQF